MLRRSASWRSSARRRRTGAVRPGRSRSARERRMTTASA